MVRLGARRSDDDLGARRERTGQVKGRAVTASSRGVRGRHSTSDILSTSAPIAPGLQLGAQFFEQLAGSVSVDSSYSGAEYGATACGNSSSEVPLVMSKIAGSRQKRPEKSRLPTNPMQRKKSKNDGWEQTGPADGGPQDLVIVPSYSGPVAGCIWRSQSDLDISDSSIGINAQDLAGVADSPRSGLSTESRGAATLAYLYRSLGQASHVDAKLSGLDIPVFSYVCTSGESGSEVVQTLHPEDHRRPTNNRVYMVKNVFIEALWLEAPSHLLTFPRGVQFPTIALITPDVLLDMVAHELDRDNIDDAMKVSRASDMIKMYHQIRR
ncbi:hypothetical protein M9H77_06668 [Catharanthus roseus]|uniref:Uncharacterized protein n=1 Tax=Catharanthus roseus TaxID=4058 RepID=A0ACC0BT54_CATRO|nr:hypothetical protein M9H77_06668 [Catharanthus roseus]